MMTHLKVYDGSSKILKERTRMDEQFNLKQYRYGLDLLQKLWEALPEDVSREETRDNIEEAIHCFEQAVQQ